MKKLNLTATLWEEECVWVAKSPETGIVSCGDTPQKALSNLKETLELYLENANGLGMRDDLAAPISMYQPNDFPFPTSQPTCDLNKSRIRLH